MFMRNRILSLLLVFALCLTLLPFTAWAAGSAYTESTDDATNTTTYTFTTFHNVNAGDSSNDQTFRVDAYGDVVMDFTHVPQSEVTGAEFILDLTKDNLTVTVKGDPAVDYGSSAITINSEPYGKTLSVTLELVDFQTNGIVTNSTNDETHPFQVSFDGACRVDRIMADYLTLSAADDAASLSFVSSLFDDGALTMDGGTYQMGANGISYPQVTIKNANLVFSKTSGVMNEYQSIEAQKLTIEDSTIQGVASIYSVKAYGDTYQQTFEGSSITIQNSVITYGDEVNASSYTGMLCNAETITIDGSTITGAAAVWDAACIGGIFETLTIRGSEVYIESEVTKSSNRTSPAIGPDDDAYTNYMDKLNITESSITIENSIVQAASRHSAAIGLPYLKSSADTTGLPQLSITIKGNSNITATSVYSPAIGGSGKAANLQDDGLVAAEIVVDNPGSIGAWEQVDGGDSAGELSLAAAPTNSGLSTFSADAGSDVSLMAATEDSVLENIETARNLLDNCTITISSTDSGTPTISAKSGVLAVYGNSVTVTGTNLVQATMVRTTGSTWSVYPMETPGDVTIGTDTIGQLGYGYASVAGTGITAQSSVGMTFGDSSLKDVVNDSFDFTTSGTGFEAFYVTPQELPISGTVTLTSNGTAVTTAAVDDTLTADLTGLSPVRAKDRGVDGSYTHLSFQWYRDGTAISGATGTTYKLVAGDSGAIITCVVSVKTGDTMFTGSVTSSAVLVGTTSLNPPTLDSRTENSITLVNAGTGYTYSKDYGQTWQSETTFTGLEKGTAYTFIQKSGDAISTAATFYTLSDTPAETNFTIDYEAERLTFPEGVLLYSDAGCQTCLNAYSPRTWISISDYTGTTLYARYSTVDASDTQSVTEIKIPARPTVSEVTATVTGDTITFTGESGVAYRLTLDDAQVGEIKTGDGANSIEFTGLQPGTEYVLTMRKEATTSSFRSAQVNQTIRTKGSYAKDSTLLADVDDTTRSYDLTDLLGGLNIDTVTATTGSFVTGATKSGSTITLNFDTHSAGDETTVTVTAKVADDTSTLTLTLTVKAVEVMAVNETASVFWVKETAHSGYVGMDESKLNSAWIAGLKTAGLTNHTHENSFALVPRYVVGGGTATKETATPEITWQVTGAADAANTDFTVLYIDSNKAATQITPVEKQDDTLTFNAQSQTALYLVAWKERQGVTITVNLRNDTLMKESSEFQHGQSLTASVSVYQADSTSSLPAPSGTVTLWLGEPNADDSMNLGEGTLSNWSASISYTLDDDTPYSNSEQTLYIVYSGDENYNSKTETKTVTFKAAAPDKPVLSAEAGLDSVKLTWEAPATHGSPITGYELAVTQNGNPIQDSPFTIDADATAYTVSNLESGKEYSFTLTAKSAAGNASSQAVTVMTLSQSAVTILVPSGADGSRSYNLYQWLGSGSNATVTVEQDTNNIVNTEGTAYNGSALTLNYNDATAGQTATLVIQNGTKLLTVTVEVVDVVKEYTSSGTFVVKGEDDPNLVNMSQEDLTTAWNTKLNTLGMENAQTDAFSLIPRYIVGGQTASIFATVDWAPDDEIDLADYRFVVLEMYTYKTVGEIKPTVSDDKITFNTSSSAPLYLVAWKALETPTIDVTFDGSEFELGSTVTATVTVSGTSGTPSGTVTVYLGDPASGSLIGQKNLSGGTVSFELSTSGMNVGDQTLTFVYGANGNYKSASTAKTITLVPAGTSQSETILLPVGSGVQRDYDLSALLDGAEIKTVAEGTDSGNILSSATNEGPTLKLTGSADAEGKTATVTVTAEKTDGSTLTLNLTVKAVTVMAEQDGVFFVQEYVEPNLVGMTTDDLLAAWDAVKEAEGFQNAGTQHSFTIRPRNIIGGDAATNASDATVTWTPSGSQTPVAEGSFLVLHIGQGDTTAEAITYTRTDDSLTFTADSAAALYCVVYKEATGGAVTVSAELQKNGTATNSFRYGDTLTAVVTIKPDTPASGLNPGGTVYLYLGDPADGGKLLASGQMSDGSGTITYTLDDESILSNAEQTLYIVYPGDNNYLSGQITVKAYLQPAPSVSGGGIGVATYPVTVAKTEHGTVTVSPRSASQGGTVTVTTVPEEGYELASLVVTDARGNRQALTDKGEGVFTFTMPGSAVTVTAEFRLDYAHCGGAATCPLRAFTDVDPTAWYHDGIHYCLANGLMEGIDDALFAPNANMTRAMVWAILARIDGETVTGDTWAADAQAWAVAEGVSDGTNPTGAVTREQFVTMLYRYAVAKGYDVSIGESTNILSYADFGQISEWAIPAMQWACGSSVITGVTDSTLAPQDTATRAQCAAMLMRFVEL